MVGRMYIVANKKLMKSIQPDFTKDAVSLMQKADAGDAEAQYKFATYLLREPSDYSYRKDISPDEVERGLRYLQKAATQGYYHGIAADELGMIYYRGEITPKDYKKAKLWFNTALMKGIPTAAYHLGECAYYGYDEDVDFEKAATYYLQVAPQYVNALIRIADMYLRGEYFPLDPSFANELYEHVRISEEWFYRKNKIFSDANDMVFERIEEMKRSDIVYPPSPLNEAEKQRAAREKLLEIMERDKERWEKWGDS